MATGKEIKGIKQPVKMRFRKLADGRKSIFLDHSSSGKHSYEFLKLYLLPETTKANEKKNKAVLKEAKVILKERTTALVEKKGKEQTAMSSKMLVSDWLDMYHTIQERRGARALRNINTLKLVMGKFDASARLCDVDKDFFLRLIHFVRHEYVSVKGTPLHQKTAWNYVDNFSISISAAVRVGLLSANPYFKVATVERIKPPQGLREYLTIDEVKILIDAPIIKPHKREVVKNAFLFSCFCGLRLSDLKALKWRDVSEELGRKYVSVVMQKTAAPVYIPLSKQAERWLPERVDDNPDSLVFAGMKDEPLMRRYLAEWVESAGINKHITFHCGRHTCATMLMTLGADIYTVSKILGHTSLKHTQVYAKMINSKKDEAVNLADKAFA